VRLGPSAVVALIWIASAPARADVVFDGSTRPDGLRSELPAFRGVYAIEEAQGARPGGGPNLFHSFERLDVESGNRALFRGDPALRNVIARVTGGSPTRIDGALLSDIPGVQLFLLNRHGVLFGAGSQVRVSGGFFASSAPLLRLGSVELRTDAADGSFAGAVEPVSAFAFRADSPAGPVRLEGARLRFEPAGGVFGFVGGEVEIRGGAVSARAGDVALAAVRGDGSILLRDAARPEGVRRIEFEGVSEGGPIRIHSGALVSSSGFEPEFGALDAGSGEVVIRGGELVIEDAEVLSHATGGVAGGDIDAWLLGDARIERVALQDVVGMSTRRLVSSQPGAASAGDVLVRARSAALLGGAKLTASTGDAGAGGNVEVEAASVRISGFGLERSALRSNAESSGDAGTIRVRAGELLLDDFGALVAESSGEGRAGDIDLELGSLEMAGNARIDSSIRGSGEGGDIEIDVAGTARLSGASSDVEFTGITTLGHATSSVRAGTIELSAQSVSLSDGARISARSEGLGDAGSVRVEAADSIELERASIETESLQRDGGNIGLFAPELVMLRDGSALVASVRSGTGGNVTVDPEVLIVDGSRIEARAEDGTGGNIDLTAGYFLVSADSSISADSERGVDGTVVLRSPSSDAAAGPGVLDARYREPEASLAARCQQSRAGSFVAAGIAAPPWTPDEPRFASHARLAAVEAIEARGDLESALAQLEAIPEDAAVHALRSRLLVRLGRAGLDAELEPLDRALLRAARGEREPALEELARAADPGSERAALLVAAGRAPEARSAWNAARSRLEAAADAPDRTWAQLRLARVGESLDVPAAELAALYTAAAERASAVGDAAARGYAWAYLAGLYERRGRLDDAAALAGRALLAAQEARRPELELIAWRQAGRVALARGELAPAESSLRRARSELERLRASAALTRRAQSEFARALPAGPLATELVDVLLRRAAQTEDPAALQALLREARDQLEDQGAAELRDWFRDACAAPLRPGAAPVPPGAAIVHPVLLPDRAELIVELSGGMQSVPLPVAGAEIARAARELRASVEDPAGFRFWRPARQLHAWLAQPLERALAGREVDTLVFAPLGALRGVPFAALHDPEHGFLVERYAIAITPGIRLMQSQPVRDAPGARLLRGGLTRAVQGYPALGHVSGELEAIGGVFGGPELIDEQFVEPALAGALAASDFPIVHLASHGEFGGALEQSFLLTFDGKLRVDELAGLVRRDPRGPRAPLELLTLSACQTAAGDERAALGLAGVAVEAGAQSALATLWYVDDASSGRLMTEFYRALADPGASRARALQRAQQSLIAAREFRHPAYWAPFVLIGSWQ
jgi:filamentous hemagglutinin family protein